MTEETEIEIGEPSHWSANLGRSGMRQWRDGMIEDQEEEEFRKAEREEKRKKVDFVRMALAAHDEAEQDKKRERLPRWRVLKEDDDKTPTYVDTGANVNVCSENTGLWLEELGFVYKVRDPGDARDFIVFGKKGAQSEIIGYVEGEGLIDRLAVVKEIEANLISINTFTKRGMVVIFGDDDVKIMQGDTMRFKGYKDRQTELYRVDIVDLLMTPGDEDVDGDGETSGESESESERRGRTERDRRKRGKEEHNWKAAYTARAAPRFKAQAIRRAMELHRHMKHIPLAVMANNIECGAWTGLDPMITPQLLRDLAAKGRCLVCAAARWNQKVHHGSGTRVYLPGEAFALDYQGLISPKSFGCSGFIVIRDLGTGFFEVYGVRDKRAVTEAVRRWVTFMLSFGHTPKFGRHDSGAVETGQEFEAALAELGINKIASPPEIPEKNIERTVQTIQNDIAAMMISTPSFGAKDWLFAAKHSARMRSTMVCAASKVHHPAKSPYELVCRRKPRMDLLTDIAVGDITVIRTPLKLRRLGQPRNQVARVMEIELDDARAAKVQVLGSEKIVRRGNLQKVHVQTAEEETTGKPPRVVTVVTAADGKTTVTASPGLSTDSIAEVARQEIDLEKARETEEVAQIKENLQKARAAESDGEESGEGEEERAGPADGGARGQRSSWLAEEDEKADAGTYTSDKDEERAGSGGEQNEHGHDGGNYWASEMGEENQTEPTVFWTKQLRGNKIPDKDTVDEVWMYSVITGGAMPSDELMGRARRSPPRGKYRVSNQDEDDDDLGEGDGGEGDNDTDTDDDSDNENDGGAARHFTVLKTRKARDSTCPTNRMLEKDPLLNDEWIDSDNKELSGLYKVTHGVTKERADEVGVTPHVTDRKTKRKDNLKKTRMAINGSFEVRQGRFPNKHVLHSPAMDDELLKLTVQFATHFRMDMESSDVTQCFTHSPMKGARFERPIVIYLTEFECGKKGGDYREFDAVSYGTADASSEWYRNYRKAMLEMGFRVSVFHPCLFVKLVAEKSLLIVSVATDDMLKASTRDDEGRAALAQFNADMAKRWPVTHETPVREMLGVKFERHEDGSITLTQPGEIEKIRKAFFGDEPVPEVLVPCYPPIQATAIGIEDETDDEPVSVAEYRSKLGTLGYIRVTRHDVLVMLSLLAERAHRPTRLFLTALYWLAAYLVTTAEVGLTYQPGPIGADIRRVLDWTFWSDCSWATRSKGASCLGAAVVLGDYSERAVRLRRPFTAPITAKSIKETGPPSDSASAGELQATVMALNMGMIIRGMSEELAGVVKENETSSTPEGMAAQSPLFVTARESGRRQGHERAGGERQGDEDVPSEPTHAGQPLAGHGAGPGDDEEAQAPAQAEQAARVRQVARAGGADQGRADQGPGAEGGPDHQDHQVAVQTLAADRVAAGDTQPSRALPETGGGARPGEDRVSGAAGPDPFVRGPGDDRRDAAEPRRDDDGGDAEATAQHDSERAGVGAYEEPQKAHGAGQERAERQRAAGEEGTLQSEEAQSRRERAAADRQRLGLLAAGRCGAGAEASANHDGTAKRASRRRGRPHVGAAAVPGAIRRRAEQSRGGAEGEEETTGTGAGEERDERRHRTRRGAEE